MCLMTKAYQQRSYKYLCRRVNLDENRSVALFSSEITIQQLNHVDRWLIKLIQAIIFIVCFVTVH